MAAMREAHGREEVGSIQEEAVRLGAEANLVGILARPAQVRPGAPAVVILNAGVLHRVGPHRLHVVLARRLAARGVPSLRLDLAGIGDSLAVAGSQSFRDSAVADTRTAMTALATLVGAERCVIFGLCSGADNGLATALVDERVVGLVLVDPPTYRTRRSQARQLARHLARLGGARAIATWSAGVAERRVRALVTRAGSATSALWSRVSVGGPGGGRAGDRRSGGTAGGPATSRRKDDEPERSEGRELPPRPVYRDMLRRLLARRVQILAIFSGALRDRYNHADHLFELFPEVRGRIDRAYFPEANHMFTERAARAALLATVTDWIAGRSFPA